MGVISLTPIQAGICFGPIPTALMIADPAYLVGNMTCDTFPEIPTTRVNLHQSTEMHRLIEWVPYLRSARCPKEQNLDLLREKNGEIFYRISRPVEIGEELLIWFSQEYCDQIGIPTSPPGGIDDRTKDTIFYKCEHCSDKFKFPYPFICHNMFKCRANQNPKLTIPLTSSTVSSHTQMCPPIPLFTPTAAHIKRKSDQTNDLLYKEMALAVTHSNASTSPSEGSAFRKVSKCSPTLDNYESPPSVKQLVPPHLSPIATSGLFGLQNLYFQHQLSSGPLNKITNNNNNTLLFPPSYYPPPSYLQINSMAAVAAAELAASSAAVNRFVAPASPPPRLPPPPQPAFTSLPKSGNPMVEKLLQSALTGESMVPNPLSSLSLTQNWCAKCNATFRMTSDLVYHMRTHHKRDREVDSVGMVSTAAEIPGDISATQAGQIRSKRNEHLRCDICGENFKERHHLTRHMTSHD